MPKEVRKNRNVKQVRKAVSVVRYWLIVAFILLIAEGISYYAWVKVKAEGDNDLKQRQYSLAILEYDQLKLINPFSKEPNKYIAIAKNGEKDVLTLKSFYQQIGDSKTVKLMNMAVATYPNPQSATLACQTILKNNDPQLAEICIQRTVQKWPKYLDAWTNYYYINLYQNKTQKISEKQIVSKIQQIDPTTKTLFP